MLISTLIRQKGPFVATIRPEATVAELLDGLEQHRVGALVVSRSGEEIDGVVSERDVVRHLARTGAELLHRPVSSVMTREVFTCAPNDTVEDLMGVMTRRRIRHVPVVEDGRLGGIVSIGDVVKSRLDEIEGERDDLIDYISR